MSTERGERSPKTPELIIEPEIGRFIEQLDIAQQLAQARYGTSIDGLRQQGEPNNDYSKITEVVKDAGTLVGPEDEYVREYNFWKELRADGHHNMSFHDWRISKKGAYKAEYERLTTELDKRFEAELKKQQSSD